MDSLSQAALGAVIGHAVLAPSVGRRALVLGAALGTLPDLDVLVRYADAVDGFTRHRSWSHSVVVLTFVAPVIAAGIRRFGFREATYGGLLAAVWLVLITHPLLDAFTVYGTQIWWPLDVPPTVWGSLFIIDPLVTLPLVLAVLLVALKAGTPQPTSDVRSSRGAPRSMAIVALALVGAYIGWTLIAKHRVAERVRDTLAMHAIDPDTVAVLPLPLSLLWRVLVIDGERYLEGYRSLLDPDEPIEFRAYTRGLPLLEATGDQTAVTRLRWFTGDRVRAAVDGDRLAVTDLRIGAESNYVFAFDVARWENERWTPIVAEARAEDIDILLLGDVWWRMWRPDASLGGDGRLLRPPAQRGLPET